MNRSKASKHYQRLLDWNGTLDERREDGIRRPMGFQPPKAVEVRGSFPYGVESQTWEAWHEEYE